MKESTFRHLVGFGAVLRLSLALAFLWQAPICVRAAESGIDFIGVMVTGKNVRVALADRSTGVSKWIDLGHDFSGYNVSAFDPATDMLTLTKGSEKLQLKLKAAKVVGVKEAPPEIKRPILNNLRQLAAAADQFYLENGVHQTTYDQLVGPMKFVKQVNAIDGEDYRVLTFSQGTTLSVTTRQGFTISYQP